MPGDRDDALAQAAALSRYERTKARLLAVTRFAVEEIAEADLADLLRRIEAAHALGPMLDPTLYRAGADAMSALAEVARAVQHLREVWRQRGAAILRAARHGRALREEID
jgi:endo-alpha-1,4-polygalactosaminidase (GH114 family)